VTRNQTPGGRRGPRKAQPAEPSERPTPEPLVGAGTPDLRSRKKFDGETAGLPVTSRKIGAHEQSGPQNESQKKKELEKWGSRKTGNTPLGGPELGELAGKRRGKRARPQGEQGGGRPNLYRPAPKAVGSLRGEIRKNTGGPGLAGGNARTSRCSVPEGKWRTENLPSRQQTMPQPIQERERKLDRPEREKTGLPSPNRATVLHNGMMKNHQRSKKKTSEGAPRKGTGDENFLSPLSLLQEPQWRMKPRRRECPDLHLRKNRRQRRNVSASVNDGHSRRGNEQGDRASRPWCRPRKKTGEASTESARTNSNRTQKQAHTKNKKAPVAGEQQEKIRKNVRRGKGGWELPKQEGKETLRPGQGGS